MLLRLPYSFISPFFHICCSYFVILNIILKIVANEEKEKKIQHRFMFVLGSQKMGTDKSFPSCYVCADPIHLEVKSFFLFFRSGLAL